MSARRPFSFLDKRTFLQYFLLLLIFLAGVWLVLATGSRLHPANEAAQSAPAYSTSILWENFRTSISILLIQIIVILILAGLFRRLSRAIHQPPVMGEMIAGIVLG